MIIDKTIVSPKHVSGNENEWFQNLNYIYFSNNFVETPILTQVQLYIYLLAFDPSSTITFY